MTKKHVILFLVIILVVSLLAATAGYFVGRHQTQDTEQKIEDDYLQWLVMYFEQPCSSFEFDLNNPLSDEALLRYFSYSGCYNPQRKWIRQEMIPFYSNTTFSVPCEMVETDITEHFGIGLNREKIGGYNSVRGTYEIPTNTGEFYYNIEILSQKHIKDDVYEFTASITHDIAPETIPVRYRKYVMEIKDDTYKYLSVQTITP